MIAGLTIIKNEEQIIELFCRHNLNILDKLYIIDNCSFDHTIDIIEQLIEEGLNIELTKGYPSMCHTQEIAVTEKIKTLTEDWVFVLDADEFINLRRDKQTLLLELSKIDKTIPHKIYWNTYVPTKQVESTDNFLLNITERKVEEKPRLSKLVIPKEIINDNIKIYAGNHDLVDSNDEFIEAKPLISAVLAHIPIRTKFNTIQRLLLNSHTLSMKKERKPDETTHWDLFAAFIRKRNYNLSIEDLQKIAENYGSTVVRRKVDLVEDPIKTFDNVYVKYTNRCNPIMMFDKYIGALIENNKEK